MSRQRDTIIREARELGDVEAESQRSSFEGTDKLLAAAVSILHGNGFYDDEAGDTDSGGHAIRIGAVVAVTDSQGFVHVTEAPDVDSALKHFAEYEASDEEPAISELRVCITGGNAAMQSPEEFAAALRGVAGKIEQGHTNGTIFDTNGNTVGSFEVQR